MKLQWTGKAQSDLRRLYDFLAPVNRPAAVHAAKTLAKAPENLLAHPSIGEKLEEFAPRDVRRIIVNDYEIRYELKGAMILILRLWHTREDR